MLSCDELGFEALIKQRPSLVVVVASSTGDGDPPDNATKFFAAMRKKSQPAGTMPAPEALLNRPLLHHSNACF